MFGYTELTSHKESFEFSNEVKKLEFCMDLANESSDFKGFRFTMFNEANQISLSTEGCGDISENW